MLEFTKARKASCDSNRLLRNEMTFLINIYTDMDELMVGVLEHEPCLLQAG